MNRTDAPLGRRRTLRIAAAGLFCAVVLASCSPGRIQLSAGAAQCFEVLPNAQKAVSAAKVFYGVRLISDKTAQAILSGTIPQANSDYCLVAYRLELPRQTELSRPTKHFELVVVAPKSKQVIAIREVRRLPFSFRRSLSVN